MEAVHVTLVKLSFAKPLVAYFKLHLVPKAIFIVRSECFVWGFELSRKSREVDKILNWELSLKLLLLFVGEIERIL